MSFTITQIPSGERDAWSSLVFSDYQEELFQKQTELLAAAEDEVPQSALLARVSEGRYEILSLYTEEDCRMRGAASALLDAASQRARDCGCEAVTVGYAASPEEEEALHAFFLRRGFSLPQEETTVFTLPVRSLADTRLASLPEPSGADAHIFPMRTIPSAAAADYRARLGRGIPQALDPSQAPGTVLPELCLAWVEKERVISFVVFSDLGDMLHLHAVYLDTPSHGGATIALLHRVNFLREQSFSHFSSLSVTIATRPAERLMRKLLEGAELSRRTSFTAFRPVSPGDLPLPDGFGEVYARSNALMEALAASGLTVSQHWIPGSLPFLELEGLPETVQFSYFLQPSEESASDADPVFLLTASAFFSSKDIAPQRLAEAAAAMAADPGPAVLYTEQKALCASLSEGAAFHAETSVDSFVNPFLSQLERCRALLTPLS